MNSTLKCVAALILAALVSCACASMDLASGEEIVSDPVIPGLADGGALLHDVLSSGETPAPTLPCDGDEECHYVNFYSQDGATVLLTVSVEVGYTVTPAEAPPLEGKRFRGWAMAMQGDAPIFQLNAFDFSLPICDALPDGEKTLNLYAWYAREIKVSFVSNGGDAVPTQRVVEGDMAAYAEPAREGYTFVGWSSSGEEYVAFDFAAPVYEDLTLYAFWQAKLVTVQLVYMLENPNDDGYTPAGHTQTVYAPAGSYLSIEKSDIVRLGQTHSVRTSAGAQREWSGYAYESGAGGAHAFIPDVYDTYFQYATASNDRFVMPDGTTVMLLYYNRVRVTLSFQFSLYSNGSMNIFDNVLAQDQAKYALSYAATTTNAGFGRRYQGFTYRFRAKYGQNIASVWPRTEWVITDGDFYGWEKPNNTIQVSHVYTLVNDLFPRPGIRNGTLVADSTLPAVGANTNTYWLIYARTTLPGEQGDFLYQGKRYTIYQEACQQALSTDYFGYKALTGCTPATSKTYGATYPNLNQITEITALNGTLQELFYRLSRGRAADGQDHCQILLYDRGAMALTVIARDDTYGMTAQRQSYLYGDWIYNDEEDLLKIVEANMKKANCRFAGWFTDADCTHGSEYVPDAESRMAENMNLYAKWEPSQFTAEYYLYTDDGQPYAQQGFQEGGRIEDKLVPAAVQMNFLGWHWYQAGRLERFDFSAIVGAAHVDEHGVLRLYAVWKGNAGRVSFLPGMGGDNATQEVFDERDFELHSASVELPNPQEVWPTGVPGDDTLTFTGWKAPSGAIYPPGRYVPVTRPLMRFEAQWSRDAVRLIYHANGGEGEDVAETWARGSVAPIWDNMDAGAPHFTRAQCTLLGWDEDPHACAPSYALGGASIVLTQDVTALYAIWQRTGADVTIQKRVTGNMGERDRLFAFEVHSDADTLPQGDGYELSGDRHTAKFALAHGQSVTIQNVPTGAVLTISEEAEGYETSMAHNSEGVEGHVIAVREGDNIIIVTNHWDVIPDTGIVSDSMPYKILLALVAGIGAATLAKRLSARKAK